MLRKLVAAVSIAVLSAFAAGSAFAAPGGLGPPGPDTPSGEAISRLYWIVLGLCAVVFVLVETALILFIVRFRRRRDTPESAEGPQIHGNTRLEIIWTAIPAIILAALAIFTFTQIPAVQARGVEDEAHLTVRRRGAPVLLGVPLPGRRDDREHPLPPGRRARRARAHRHGRHPQLVGSRPHGEDGCHPRPHQLPALRPRDDRRLRGQVRRALRRPARVHADHGHRPEPGRVRVHARLRSRRRSRSGKRPGKARALRVTAWTDREMWARPSRETAR